MRYEKIDKWCRDNIPHIPPDPPAILKNLMWARDIWKRYRIISIMVIGLVISPYIISSIPSFQQRNSNSPLTSPELAVPSLTLPVPGALAVAGKDNGDPRIPPVSSSPPPQSKDCAEFATSLGEYQHRGDQQAVELTLAKMISVCPQ
jgi:hypothetical protein